MNFHDYHLRGYSVSGFGATVVLDLVYDYPEQPVRYSEIEFNGVELYHFIHTGGAIITEILPSEVAEIVSSHAASISEWAHQYGVAGWTRNVDKYIQSLKDQGLNAWVIESAVGFSGFIIAAKASQRTHTAGEAVVNPSTELK